MKRSRCNVTICIVVLLVGIVFSASIAGMRLAGKINLDHFYNVGEVYEFFYSDSMVSGVNWIYDSEKEQIEITDENAYTVLYTQAPCYISSASSSPCCRNSLFRPAPCSAYTLPHSER